MKFTLVDEPNPTPTNTKKSALPPNSGVKKHVASQGGGGSASGHGPTGKTLGAGGKSPVGFSGKPLGKVSVTSFSPPSKMPKPA